MKDNFQGTKDFVAWQKIVGLQIDSMASLRFGDSWENFGKVKTLYALEMPSCWHIFLWNKQNFALCKQALALMDLLITANNVQNNNSGSNLD